MISTRHARLSAAMAAAALAGLFADGAAAQSLFVRPAPPAATPGQTTLDLAEPLYGMSLTAVRAPRPREYFVHDQVTIIINENSKQKSDQSLDTKKDSDVSGELNAIIDPLKLALDGQLVENSDAKVLLDAEANRSFKGDGSNSRDDQYTDRITATVLDVKPNGILVLEARRVLQYDKDIKTVVVSGSCRAEDITRQATILSNQLADLTVIVHHEGPLAESASKGWLTQFFEFVFPF